MLESLGIFQLLRGCLFREILVEYQDVRPQIEAPTAGFRLNPAAEPPSHRDPPREVGARLAALDMLL